MRRSAVITSAIAAGAAAAALSVGSAAGSSSTPLTIVYDSTPATHQLVFPTSGRGLSPARGALRQDPGRGGMFVSGNNSTFRISRVSGAALQNMSVANIVTTLESQIIRGTYGASAHIVAIDELLSTYGENPRAVRRRALRFPPSTPTAPAHA